MVSYIRKAMMRIILLLILVQGIEGAVREGRNHAGLAAERCQPPVQTAEVLYSKEHVNKTINNPTFFNYAGVYSSSSASYTGAWWRLSLHRDCLKKLSNTLVRPARYTGLLAI